MARSPLLPVRDPSRLFSIFAAGSHSRPVSGHRKSLESRVGPPRPSAPCPCLSPGCVRARSPDLSSAHGFCRWLCVICCFPFQRILLFSLVTLFPFFPDSRPLAFPLRLTSRVSRTCAPPSFLRVGSVRAAPGRRCCAVGLWRGRAFPCLARGFPLSPRTLPRAPRPPPASGPLPSLPLLPVLLHVPRDVAASHESIFFTFLGLQRFLF